LFPSFKKRFTSARTSVSEKQQTIRKVETQSMRQNVFYPTLVHPIFNAPNCIGQSLQTRDLWLTLRESLTHAETLSLASLVPFIPALFFSQGEKAFRRRILKEVDITGRKPAVDLKSSMTAMQDCRPTGNRNALAAQSCGLLLSLECNCQIAAAGHV